MILGEAYVNQHKKEKKIRSSGVMEESRRGKGEKEGKWRKIYCSMKAIKKKKEN